MDLFLCLRDPDALRTFHRVELYVGSALVGHFVSDIDLRVDSSRFFDLKEEAVSHWHSEMPKALCVCGKPPTLATARLAGVSRLVRACLPCHAVVGLAEGGG